MTLIGVAVDVVFNKITPTTEEQFWAWRLPVKALMFRFALGFGTWRTGLPLLQH
jgi:hypothetical protein